MKKLFKIFKALLKRKPKPYRMHPRDIVAGEVITIEHYLFKHGPSNVTCVANDPFSKTMLVRVRWLNYQQIGRPQNEDFVLRYGSGSFKNFHLLNMDLLNSRPEPEQMVDSITLVELQANLDAALAKEEYRVAAELHKQIEELKKQKQ